MIHHSLLSFTATFTRKHLEHSLFREVASPLPCRTVPSRSFCRSRRFVNLCHSRRWEGSARFPIQSAETRASSFFLFFPTRVPWQRTGPKDRSASLPNWIFKSRSTQTNSFFSRVEKRVTRFSQKAQAAVCRRFFLFLPFYNFTKIKPTEIGSFLRLHTRDSFK